MNDPKTVETAEQLYTALSAEQIDALIDDRTERAGVKFKDADLIGIPTQVIIGEKNLKEGLVEFKNRKTKETVKVPVEEVVARVKAAINS